MKIEIAVDRRRRSVEFSTALNVDAAMAKIEREIAVGEATVKRDLCV